MSRRDRLVVAIVVAVAAALRIPTLFAGFGMDDYAQLAMLGGVYPVDRAPWDLFTFSSGDPDEVRQLMQRGSLAWWSDPELRLSAFRPLSSVLIALDVAVFGYQAFWHHLHSLLWWVALLLVVAGLLWRLLPRPVALLALVLYALDECHAFPLAWLANRNVLVSAVFGVLGIWMHLRWREDGWRPGLALEVVAFVLAFAGGEYALAAVAYVVGYELLGANDGVRKRVMAVLPLLLVTCGYVLLHRLLGFGTQYSGIYTDPLREPFLYLRSMAIRIPVLLGDMFLAIPTGRMAFHPRMQPLQMVAGVVGLALVAWLLITVRRAVDARPRQVASWMLLAAVMALVPVSGSFVSARLLVIPAIGGHVVLAMILVHGWSRLREGQRSGGMAATLGQLLRGGLGLAHLVLAPYWGLTEASSIARLNRGSTAAILASEIDDARVRQQRIVVLAVHDPNALLYPRFVRWVRGAPLPRSWWVLSMAGRPHRLSRPAPDALELEVVGGEMLTRRPERMFRGERLLRVGQNIRLDGLTIRVLEMGDRGPTRVRYEFDEPLGGEGVLVLVATADALRRYPLPPVGHSMLVPRANLLMRQREPKP